MGTILALGGLGWLLSETFASIDGDVGPTIAPLIFGVIAVMAAVRVVTHRRPVFAALYFILVVIASAGLFLMLHAEFMAFALIIVYAGAILITYLFVLMLAQEASTEEGESPYNYIPREPIPALVVGFVLVASIGDALLSQKGGLEPPTSEAFIEQAYENRWSILDQLPRQKTRMLEELSESTGEEVVDDSFSINGSMAEVQTINAEGVTSTRQLGFEQLPTNTQEVGWELVAGFPVGLEIAGVILLMAMFGAVVLARRQIELGEDELRVAGGLEPLHANQDEDSDGEAS